MAESRPGWLTYSEGPISVHVAEGSFAARRAEAEVKDAERIVEELEDLLDVPGDARGAPIDIYVVDAAPGLAPGAPIAEHATARGLPAEFLGADIVVRVVQPDTPSEPLASALTRLSLKRWFSEGAGAAGVVQAGIAGVVAARTESGPSVEEAREAVIAAVAAGNAVSIFGARPAGASAADPAATAFVSFLIDRYGQETLRRFLQQFDPARQDDAAVAVYQEPLAALEEGWLTSLRRTPRTWAALLKLFGHMRSLLRSNWLREAELGLYTILDVGLGVALPILTGRFIQEMQLGNADALLPFMVVLVGVFLLLTPVTLRRSYVSVWVSQSIVLGLQERMFERLLRLPHRFYARANVGDLMARIQSDVQQVRDGIETITRQGFYLLLKLVVVPITLFVLSPLLTILALITVPLFWVGYIVLRRRLERASLQAQTLVGEVGSATQESLSAHAVIKAFGMETSVTAAYRARLAALFRSIRRLVIIGGAFDASTSTAVTIGQLVVLGVGGYQVSHGDLDLGILIAFFGLMPQMFEPVTGLAGVGRTITEAAGSMDRVIEILDEPLAIEEKPGAPDLPPLAREIRLEGITFGYEPGRPVLRDITIAIPAGATVALVGPSGCGKSTVINLLLRFWDPEQGRVLFDGQDIRDVTIKSLRGQIGLVFQDTFVFDTTVRENIAIGREGATDAEVEEAAKAAELDTYVAGLPAGFDTVLGERGVRMSGGQRQRLAIARALLRDPKLLVLDEATSALDARTEAEITETLDRLARERTTIAITHRLTSAAEADRIFVLDQGRLVEEGTHEELVKARGLYQQLYEEQTVHAEAATRRLEVETARLKTVPLFAGLDPEQLASLAELLRLERFAAGDYIVRQGERGDAFYVLASGGVDVLVGTNGTEQRLGSLHPGEYFGEIALVADVPRVASVRASAPTEVYSLSGESFHTLLERNESLRENVFRKMDERGKAFEAALLAQPPPPAS